ncbi:hypothetical protein D3C86_1565190 [compost metagenome]
MGTEQAGRAFFQLHEQRVSARSVDFDLFEQRETDAVVQLAELADRPFVARLLLAKLVARKAQHHQALILVGLPQFFEAFVLRGETAFAGGVDHQNGFPGEIGQSLLLAPDGGARDAQQIVAHDESSGFGKMSQT